VPCSTYNWTVAGGTITSGQGTNSINVIWNDVPTDKSTTPYSTNVQVVVGGCASSTTVPAYNVFVSSISDQTPGPLTVNGTAVGASYSLPFGDTPILALRVPVVPVPISSGNTPYGAITYSWVIPSGWRYVTSSGGVLATSDGSTPRRYDNNSTGGTGYAGNAIYVQPAGNTPAPPAPANISVQAINNNCVGASAGADNSKSKVLSIPVTRTVPTLTIISDKSSSGGNFTLLCGDQSDYHFRSTSSGGPIGGSFDTYSFVFSGPITPTGTVNSATPATNFTGATGRVAVTLSARYTRNGSSTTLYASGVGIDVQALPTPTISGLPASAPGKFPVICQSTTLTASSTGANSYSWSVTGDLTLSATTGSSVTVSPSSSSRGTGGISVTASNTNAPAGTCQTNSIAYNVNVNYNPASGTYTSNSNSTPMALNESYQFAQPNDTYYILMDQNYTFAFSTVGPNGTQGIPIYPTGPRTAYFTFTGASSVQVVATATGSNIPCGQTSISSVFLAPFRSNYAMSPNPATSELTVTDNSQTDNSQPVTTSQTKESPRATKSAYAFKNAAGIPVPVPLRTFDATLYDLHGKLVKAQAGVVGKTVLNVSDLPAGLYNLRISSGQEVHSEHVQITH